VSPEKRPQFQNCAQVLAAARVRPQAVSYGSTGNGASTHLAGVQFAIAANLDLLHVPYRGQPGAMASLLAGDTDLFFNQSGAAMGPIRQGQVRPLAVMSPARLAALPDVPTVAESGLPGYQGILWMGVLAPAATPRDVIDAIHKGLVQALRDPALIKRWETDGVEAVGSAPADFARLIDTELRQWSEVVKRANIKAD
jgi:tripartite-type tricarboxylate transporter receptor subunit TctC